MNLDRFKSLIRELENEIEQLVSYADKVEEGERLIERSFNNNVARTKELDAREIVLKKREFIMSEEKKGNSESLSKIYSLTAKLNSEKEKIERRGKELEEKELILSKNEEVADKLAIQSKEIKDKLTDLEFREGLVSKERVVLQDKQKILEMKETKLQEKIDKFKRLESV